MLGTVFDNMPHAMEGNQQQSLNSVNFIDPIALLRLFLQSRYVFYVTVGLTTFITSVVMLMTPNVYQSSATILPSGQTDNVSALKDLVGLSGSMQTDENSSALYPLILQSNLVCDAVIQKSYTFSNGESVEALTLADYLQQTDPTRLRNALRDMTNLKAGKRTGEIIISVETQFPELSQAVCNEYLAQLEDYNLTKRKSSAKNTQIYLAKQITSKEEELRVAELKLEAFRKLNSDWSGSTNPEILTELSTLQRNVEVNSGALLYLQQQFEMAKFNAQKDIPIVRVLDKPSLPTLKSGPQRTVTVLSFALLATLLTAGLLLVYNRISVNTSLSDTAHARGLAQDFVRSFPRTTLILRQAAKLTTRTRSHELVK